MRVRFAPSPTGFLHLGNIRLVVINEILANKYKGTFVLRIDDTDTERSKQKYIDGVFQDFEWLKIHPDEVYYQHERMDLYKAAQEYLISIGRLYPCFETEQELALKRSMALSQGNPPLYDRSALKLSSEQIQDYKQEGRKPYYRFLLDAKMIQWVDLNFGEIEMDPTNMSDPVLVRDDTTPLYTLTSVVDDQRLKITHVVRGMDHLSNTAIQIQLFEALKGMHKDNEDIPYFCHVSLIHDIKGGVMSKRDDSLSLQNLRTLGYAPDAIKLFCAYLGTSSMPTGSESWKLVTEDFQIQDLGQSDIKFHVEDLKRLSGKVLSHYTWADVQPWFNTYASSNHITESLWELVRYNIQILEDVLMWNDHFSSATSLDAVKIWKKLDQYTQSKDLLVALLDQIRNGQLDEDSTWDAMCKRIQKKLSITGKKFYIPIRILITGLSHGPHLDAIVQYLGWIFIKERLQYLLTHHPVA